MNVLIIDFTHGGVKLAKYISKLKKFKNIYGYDIYSTLTNEEKKEISAYNVKLIELNDLKEFSGKLLVISPIHCPLTSDDIKKYNDKLNYEFISHHKAVKLVLNNWLYIHPELKIIEITGVKGKTSSVFMLNKILNNYNQLILSSLGAFLIKNNSKMTLKKDISITPANILETINKAKKVSNSKYEYCVYNSNEKKDKLDYEIAIFENSLGSCGIGDVGLLTNITENYPIAKNKSNAQEAKKQIFNCKLVVCQKETLEKYYPNENKSKINTFSIKGEANLILKEVEYSLDKTKIKIAYNNIKTIANKKISGNFSLDTFAIGKFHVKNVLGAITTALTLGISENEIINGLKSFKGIVGRSSIRKYNDSLIIEEINPGINTNAIKQSIEMIKNLNNYSIIIGGDYGITCEEINEYKLAEYLDTLNINIILTGKLGSGILSKMKNKQEYIPEYNEAIDLISKNNRNILFIYRSNYKDLFKR